MGIGVHKVAMAAPSDVSELERLIAAGAVDPATIVAFIGKTEGNGGANDFTRGFATLSYQLMLARHLGCAPEEIVFGQNMTTLNFALSRTVGRELRVGDEILATKLDHDANVAPWLELAQDLELTVRLIELRDDTTLDLDDLTKLPQEVRFMPKPWRALDVLIEAERAIIGAPERQTDRPA